MTVEPFSAASVLREVSNVINERGKNYGESRENFKQIAELWKAYKGVEFSREDVALFFILAKVARLSSTAQHRDSLVDIAGYAALAIEANQEPYDPVKAIDKIRGKT